MPHLSAAATLDLWQEAEGLDPVERSLTLAAAAADGSSDELAALPLGRRDARLLSLYRNLGGQQLEATATCPACHEETEFAVDVDGLLAREADAAPPAPVEAGGFAVRWRPPTSSDVAAAAETRDAAAAERLLLVQCVTAASGPDGEVDGAALPAEVRREVARAMAKADPLAEVLVDVTCPACEGAFVADLDLSGFVWAEIRARAHRLLREVDVLARTYGWREAEVLELDDWRRAAYLELAREGRV